MDRRVKFRMTMRPVLVSLDSKCEHKRLWGYRVIASHGISILRQAQDENPLSLESSRPKNTACGPTSCNNRTSGNTPQSAVVRLPKVLPSLPWRAPRNSRWHPRTHVRPLQRGSQREGEKRPSPDWIGTPGAKRPRHVAQFPAR